MSELKRVSDVDAEDAELEELAEDLADSDERLSLEEQEDIPPTAEELEVSWRNLPKDYPSCGVCPRPSTYSKKDMTGFKHEACTIHYPYLDGWVRSNNAEMSSESAASARYERHYE